MTVDQPEPTRRGPRRTVCAQNQRGSTVSVYLPSAIHDRIADFARRHDRSVSRVVRDLLVLRLPKSEIATDK